LPVIYLTNSRYLTGKKLIKGKKYGPSGEVELSLSVSVIIPAYNSLLTIERALNSVVGQVLQPAEIIVVDDGSQDGTADFVRNNFPTVVLIEQENAGAAAARNCGVAAAQGELIAFLDSDDLWHSQKLAIQVAAFDRFPELTMVSTRCKCLPQEQWREFSAHPETPVAHAETLKVKFNQVFSSPFLATPSVVMRKSNFLALGGFDTDLETAEDVDLWLRGAYFGNYGLVNAPLTIVVEQQGSLSDRARVSPYGQHLAVIEQFCRGKRFGFVFWWWVLPKTKSSIYCQWGSTLIRIGRPAEAFQKVTHSLLAMPSARGFYLWCKALLLMLKRE
jgi:glycosyltransferase involved in cell wall biosynthesis